MKEYSKEDLIRNRFFQKFNLERSQISKKIIKNAHHKNLKKVSNLRFYREHFDSLIAGKRVKRNYAKSLKNIEVFQNLSNFNTVGHSQKEKLDNFFNSNFFNILNPFISSNKLQVSMELEALKKEIPYQKSRENWNVKKNLDQKRLMSARIPKKTMQTSCRFLNNHSGMCNIKMNKSLFDLARKKAIEKLKVKFIDNQKAEESHPIHKLIHQRIGNFYKFGYTNKSLKFFYKDCSPVRFYSKRHESRFNLYNGIPSYNTAIRKLNLNKTQS